MAALAWWLLAQQLLAMEGCDSALAMAVGQVAKERVSLTLYAVAIAASFWNRWIACAIYVLVAAMWLVPDRRIEKALMAQEH